MTSLRDTACYNGRRKFFLVQINKLETLVVVQLVKISHVVRDDRSSNVSFRRRARNLFNLVHTLY
jgi:hypothetical protein